MGLNIGIRVKRQREEYMSYGCNPKGTQQEIEDRLREELNGKFLNAVGEFSCTVYVKQDEFDFDVRFSQYAKGFYEAGYTTQDMYLALLDFIVRSFSADYGIDMHVYHAP